MNIRLFHADIMPMEEDCRILPNHEIWVKNGKIVYLGKPDSYLEMETDMRLCGILPHGFDKSIDCGGDVLMPGFKDAHAHSAMTLFRTSAENLPLDRWLKEQIFPMEAKLLPEDIAVLSKLAIMEYVSGGITAVFDMYLTPDSIAEAFIESGMRCVQCGTVNNFTHSAKELEDFFLRLNDLHPRMSYQLGFHAEYTTDEAILKEIAALSDKYCAPVYMHLSETQKEVAQCKERHGMSPVEYLEALGMFRHGGAGFHGIYLSEHDMEILQKNHIAIVTNPGSNMKLASGIAPVKELVRRGITVAIGTDGAASNNALDMFREMYLTAGLAKLREQDAGALDAEEVLRMAVVNGAKVMGIPESAYLAVGMNADLIRIDRQMPNMRPCHDFARNLVYSGNPANVKMTMVAGRILYEDGNYHIGAKPAQLYEAAEKIVDRVIRK